MLQVPLRARVCALAVLAAGLAVWSAAGVRAQAPEREVRIERFNVEDGLAQSTVTALVQDRYGFLWIGTESGLNRYDGYAFTAYRHEPDNPGSLSSSFVNALVETPDGALWVGSHGSGLSRLDPQTGIARRLRHVETDRQSLASDRVSALFVDREDRLWVGSEAGIDRVDLATSQVTRVLSANEVVDLAQSADGDLWAATHEGVLRIAPATGRVLARWGAEALGTELASAVWPNADGTLWVGTNDAGLFRLDPRTGALERVAPAPGPAGLDIQDLLVDRGGTLWVATAGGLARRDERPPLREAWTVFLPSETDPGTLPSARTRTLLEDRSGLLWVGTWASGLAKLRRTPFRRFAADSGRPDALSSSDVMGLAEDPREDGVLWVGTYDRGLNRLDLATGTASRAGLPAPLRNGSVRGVAVAADGALWATSEETAGVWRRDPETAAWRRVPFEAGAPVERVLSLAAAPDGSVWIATYGAGPCQAAPDASAAVCPAPGWRGARAMRSDLAYTLHPDTEGRVWVSLWGTGVDVIDPERGRIASFANRPDDPASLTDNNVTSFFRDARGDLWLTTYGGGLNRLLSTRDGGSFAHVTLRDGLPNGTTYGMVPETDETVWVSTDGGLARYTLGTGEITVYGADDGLPSNEFNGYSFLRLRDGQLAFGGLAGLAVFDPATVGTEAPPPPVAVTALRVLGRHVEYPAGPSPALRLTHRQSAVAFDVAALDFTAPGDNLYRFRLDGLEGTAEWEPASPRRTAAYTNLTPGRYTFRVRAAGAGGVWNDDALTIPITVTPAWWQTGWFRLLAGLAGLAVVVLGVREVSQRRLRAEVRRLETEKRLQAERERISRDLHDHVGGQLSGLIANAELARLQRRRSVPPEAPSDDAALDRIEEDARETMRQLRETVWALHHESITLDAFRDRLASDLDARLRGHAAPTATVALEGDPAHALTPLQALHLYRIAREAITNSLKHAHASALAVTVRQRDGHLEVEVEDDGTFREAPHASGNGASGFGMGSMQARAEALGGSFSLDTDAGTRVLVRVPEGTSASAAD